MSATSTMTRRPAAPQPGRRRRSPVARFLLIVIALLLGAALLAAGTVVSQARQYDNSRTDAIVVLGASQYWGEPSPVLANRLEYAAELYRQGVAPVIVTVGGGIPGDITTEAEAGQTYLEGLGVPADAVVALPKGRDTLSSMSAVAARADRQGWDQVTVVSDRAHLARSAAIVQALGFDAHVSGPAYGDGALLTPEYIARETAGLIRFHLWDRWFITSDLA